MIGAVVSLAVLGGIGYLIWFGLRSGLKSASGQSRDAAETARSAAVAIGMFLAMLAVSVGLVDLFQAVGGQARLAGSNSDLARSLSLLIVGAPAFFLLLRITKSRAADRMATGERATPLGWSIHYVAASTIALFAVLISAAQVIHDHVHGNGIESNEVAQLFAWLVVWAGYFFVLRPHFGVRGAVHLGLGTAAGLLWLVTGVGGVAAGVLSQAYDSMFDANLVIDDPLAMWAWTAVVGLGVWGWHWWLLNGPGAVEGETRRSESWYATIVLAAVLPAIIALLIVVTGSIAGIAIWFFGTPDGPAVDWFEPTPYVMTVGLIALAIWAYHRWELARRGGNERNEALRFHAYAIVGVGLIGAVAGIALLINLVFDSISVGGSIAAAYDADNRMIVAISVLAVSSISWWRVWSGIERQRMREPAAEIGSPSRKIYLVMAAGIGGLVLATSSMWVLYVGLRDLFDGVLGSSTISDLSGPIGWAIAVLGAVWFHSAVWRADRAVLEPLKPPPLAPSTPAAPGARPAPPVSATAVGNTAEPSTTAEPSSAVAAQGRTVSSAALSPHERRFRWATGTDAGELFTLQRAAFVDEAVAYQTPDVPALNQGLDEVVARTTLPFDRARTLLVTDGDRIIGAVTIHLPGATESPRLERLMVVPDRRGQGIASDLLASVEKWLLGDGYDALTLVAGDIVSGPRALYERRGYTVTDRDDPEGGPMLLTYRKALGQRSSNQ